ncbi:MAG TPA: hypothetical protein VHF87_04360 [Methylomirabilota bacterium]|nr:hypothetical protein [Methylomirabilota bacterium]
MAREGKAPEPTVTRVEILPPAISGQAVTVRWTVDPPSPLYRRTEFTLRFPDGVDLRRVPERVWWIVVLACLYPHWALLRPCRVELPVVLGPGEAETWLRLTDAAVATLESLRGTTRLDREIEIVERGVPLAPVRLPDEGDRCATAFSGGKDSLVQVGLLAELTARPLLVTTTSPLPETHDHVTPRRRHVLAEITRRRDVAHVEVESDFRECWVNRFAHDIGYPIGVNELTDTLLYFGTTLAAGVALGARHFFLASEVEVNQNAEWAGQIVQHSHFVYSTVTQRTLQALLRPVGVRYCSLTSPLHSYQVQELLWTRYRDLRDLQYSCWQVGPAESACNRCRQCLRLALCALALGDSPRRMGVNLTRLLWSQRGWRLTHLDGGATHNLLPGRQVAAALERQTARFIQGTSLGRVAREVAADGRAGLADPRAWLALLAFARLRQRSRVVDAPPGFRAGFLAQIDPLLRERVATIFREHYRPQPESEYARVLERNNALVRRITEPLGGEG